MPTPDAEENMGLSINRRPTCRPHYRIAPVGTPTTGPCLRSFGTPALELHHTTCNAMNLDPRYGNKAASSTAKLSEVGCSVRGADTETILRQIEGLEI